MPDNGARTQPNQSQTPVARRGLVFAVAVLLVLASFGGATEQTRRTIDELRAALPASSGADRLEILNELSNGLCLRDTEAAVEYGSEAAELARVLGDREAEGYALKSIGIAYAVAGEQSRSLEYSASALAIFEATGNRIQEGKVLNNMGISYRMIDDAEHALEFYNRAMAVEEELDNPRGKARTLGNIANVHLDLSHYDDALRVQLEALAIARELDDRALTASCLNNIGTIHFEQGRYQEALSFELEALTIHEADGNVADVAGDYYNIANIKSDLGQDDEALAMYENALVAAEKVGDRVLVGSAHLGIGNIFVGRSEHAGAAEHYETARRVFEEAGHRSGMADTLDNLGICERGFGHLEQALDFHRQALAIREDTGGERAIANSCNNIGRVLMEMGDLAAAEPYLDRGLTTARAVNAAEIVRDATWHLSRLEKARGHYRAALEFLEEHGRVKDQLLDEYTRDAVARAEARFESQKREQEIELLSKENEISRLEASRAGLRTRLLLLLLVVAGAGMAWLFSRYRNLFGFWKRRSFVGHYKLVEQIASGGMGVVYRAENVVEDSRVFALKVIRDEHAADPVVRKRFLHEAALVDQLDHPHIVAVHERGEHDGRLFMAMELLEGPSLARLIEDGGRLPVDQSCHIMAQLIEVVSQIHAKGVLHRDLKPENIVLVERDGDPRFVKLLDFGLARSQSLTRLTRSGMIVGTIAYLAPEQISDQQASPASDIYALGVIFYEMLTGQPAFPGDTPVDIIKQILAAAPVPPVEYRPEIGAELDDLVLAMMAKDPAARPSGSALAAIIERCAG